MTQIAFAIYRQWGYDILKEILAFQKTRNDFQIPVLILPTEYQCIIDPQIKKSLPIYIVDPNDAKKLHEILKKHDIDIVCWYSWSWIIRKPIIDDFTNLCLHPSPLPKYRGGTPIQHQLVNGEKDSAVTLFKMSEGIDAGPIYAQSAISFLGNVQDIFDRMIDVGTLMTKSLITDATNNELKFHPQKNLENYPPNKRRTPAQSEIKLEDLQKMTFTELNNLVRGLLDPYPNAFINTPNGKLFLQEVTKYKELPLKKKGIYIELKDSYARLTKYKKERIK